MPKLFEPIQAGRLTLSHRVILPPLTRLRADDDYAPLPVVKDYYVQSAKIPGSFLIAEGTGVASQATGYPNFPEIWSEKQITAWKESPTQFTPKAALSTFRCHLDVSASPLFSSRRVAPSAIPVSPEFEDPRELTLRRSKNTSSCMALPWKTPYLRRVSMVSRYTAQTVALRSNSCNSWAMLVLIRTAQASRSAPNMRFWTSSKEFLAALARDRVGFRVSHWNKGNSLGMADPKPTYSYLVSQLKQRFPSLAYLHVIEPRVDTNWFDKEPDQVSSTESNDFLREIWAPKPFIRAGGFNRESGIEEAEKGDLIAYGRWYMANPDLPTRILKDIPFNAYDRSTFICLAMEAGRGTLNIHFPPVLQRSSLYCNL